MLPVWRHRSIEFYAGLLAGSIATGCVAGALALSVSDIPTAVRSVIALTLILSISIVSLTGNLSTLPQHRRQIPETLPEENPVSGAFQFGFELGTMVRTHVTSCLPYILVVLVVFVGNGMLMAIVASIGVGLGRSSVIADRYRFSTSDAWSASLGVKKSLHKGMNAAAIAACALAINHELLYSLMP